MTGYKGMPNEREPIAVTLDCRHVLRFKAPHPGIGEQVYCSRCARYQVVWQKSPPEYRIKCENCRFGKSYGQAKLTAETKAAVHATHRQHTVTVFNGLEVLHTFRHVHEDQLTLGSPPY